MLNTGMYSINRMNGMDESRIETDGKRKFLTCFYDRTARNWDAVIQAALRKHGLKVGECTVLCKPLKKGAINED